MATIQKFASVSAALVIEPLVQGAAGMLLQPPGFLKKIRELCTKNNILMIADEVATGFGRTGAMFACDHEKVVPDIMTVAKGITGGYLPLAATLTTDEIYRGFLGEHRELRTFFHGHTYTGNPLAYAAAIANIDLFRKERTLARLQPKIAYLTKRLAEFRKLYPHIEVLYEPNPGRVYEEKILTSLAANDPPDVFLLDSKLILTFTNEKVLLDVQSFDWKGPGW